MEKGITVRIINFEKYKGRTDVKHNSWFRCSNRLLEDHEFFDFTHEELLVWIYLLALSSQKNHEIVHVFYQHAQHVCRLSSTSVDSAIHKLTKINCIEKIRTRSVRTRNANDTDTCATRQDITDRTDITPAQPCLLPPLAEFWNEVVKKPKIKKWDDDRTRLAGKINQGDWEEACRKVAASDFLSGRVGKKWKATVDWLLNPKNLRKVIEGNYDDDSAEGEQGGGFVAV